MGDTGFESVTLHAVGNPNVAAHPTATSVSGLAADRLRDEGVSSCVLDDAEEVEDVNDGGDADKDVTDCGEVHGGSVVGRSVH